MSDRKWGLETELIRAGEPEPRILGSAIVPIFQGNVYEVTEDLEDGKILYPRLSNLPNHRVLHEKLAAISNAEAALVTSSGMSAISTTLLALLKSGDHALAHKTLYGGTHSFMERDLPDFGISVTAANGAEPSSWEALLQPKTRLFYVETMTNPLVDVLHLEEVVAFCKKHELIAVIDNTFGSPVNFRPAEWGFDVEVHSASKYLNGHSDLIAGAIIGRSQFIQTIKRKLEHLGGSLDPHACFMLHRGMRTLALRVRAQNAGALALATYLAGHSRVTWVSYPGLKSHPEHERASRLFDGYGGVLSFTVQGDAADAERVINGLELFFCGPSLGGVESLVTRPSTTSHAGMGSEARKRAGIEDALIRVAVGIENPEDLIADMGKALSLIEP